MLAANVDLKKKRFIQCTSNTLGLIATSWDYCKDYWLTHWLVIRDRECCNVARDTYSSFYGLVDKWILGET